MVWRLLRSASAGTLAGLMLLASCGAPTPIISTALEPLAPAHTVEPAAEPEVVADFPAPELSKETLSSWNAFAERACERETRRRREPATADCTSFWGEPCGRRDFVAELHTCTGAESCLELVRIVQECARCDIRIPERALDDLRSRISEDCNGVMSFMERHGAYAENYVVAGLLPVECAATSKHPRARVLAASQGGPESVDILLRDVDATLDWLRLELRPGQKPLTDPWSTWSAIDVLGDTALALAPELRRIAGQRHGPYDPRDAALRLGQLGDTGAIDVLRRMLEDRTRWTAQLTAARAIAALGPAAAALENELRAIARSHWSEAVRAMAAHAAQRVVGRESDEPDHRWDPYDPLCPPGVARVLWASEPSFDGGHWRERWPWGAVFGGVSMQFEERRAPVVETFPGFPTLELGAKYRTLEPGAMTRLPEAARVIHPMGDGWLVGTNFGEFGGSLWWIGRRGAVRHLARANVIELVTLGSDLYVVSGLAHMGSDTGDLLRVRQTRRGVVVEHALELPSSPERIWPREEALFVGTLRGIVKVDADLTITLAPCEGGPPEGFVEYAAVRATIERHRRITDRCLEAVPSSPCDEPVLPRVGLWFRIDDHGAVVEIAPMVDGFVPRIPEVEACIIEHASAWHFPSPTGEWGWFGYVFERRT